MKKNNSIKPNGLATIIIVLIIAGALIIMVVGGYFIIQLSKNKLISQQGSEVKDPATALADLTIQPPLFDFVLAPLNALKVSAFNLLMPNLPSNNIFPSFSTNTNFNYTGDTSIAVPTVTIDYTPPVPTTPTTPTTPSGGQTDGQTTDCAQFAAPPSCSYVGVPGSAGYEACKKCYPNK